MNRHIDGPSIWRNMIVTVGCLLPTVLASELLQKCGLAEQNLALVYILSIAIIARFTDGYIFGISAAVVGAFLYDFLISCPRMDFSFTIGFPFTLLIMLAVSLLTCAITTQMKGQTLLAQEREIRAERLHEASQKILAARDIEEIARLACACVDDIAKGPSAFYCGKPGDGEAFGVLHETGTEGEMEVFHSLAQRTMAAQILRGPWTPPGTIVQSPPVSYIVLSSKERILALIGIRSVAKLPDYTSASFLQTLIGQISLAVELQFAFDRQQAIRIDAETEKMRGNLLRAISHDLRTPLTGILSAGAIIEDQAETLPCEQIRSMAMDIRKNSEWLIRMVENLLTVTRISQGAMKVAKTWEIAEEVMAQSVSIVRKRFANSDIRVEPAAEPLLVPMDPILITQVLINLLENAVKYSPPGSAVHLSMRWNDDEMQFRVADQGPGIPEGILGDILENRPTRAAASDSVSGMGIGLSICKTIMDAHDGKILGCNEPGGGVVFIVTLPMKEAEDGH